ncbi:hypothetical protein PPL_02063 [Heterostelium album PN500]|uniref:CYTH domain-containing protein n=1 Tax=Heterostelium pallidum (strain ATCC 26659 / Pp 5 / PN500) TaxID=670386 RepID=D3B192_HETP5|nr:hypothetical protein PPL_02063 [Heterostelium album PN500]EFA85066.1 hypothetical protein PPL_02063 [Heterostelium album PN500]|eukprot:XP_020437176.1 hypothetical protein PPL_02063 [Heterostelium album PN500]
MIEIEVKIPFNDRIRNQLLQYKVETIGEQSFTDVYYEDENYSLTTRNIWLRQRNDIWELKLPRSLSFNNNQQIQQQNNDVRAYKEVFELKDLYIELSSVLIDQKIIDQCFSSMTHLNKNKRINDLLTPDQCMLGTVFLFRELIDNSTKYTKDYQSYITVRGNSNKNTAKEIFKKIDLLVYCKQSFIFNFEIDFHSNLELE